MSTYAVHAARFLLPGGVSQGGYLPIEDGRFGAWLAEPPSCEVVDAGDAWVAPGFVDTHIHGFFGHATTDNDPAGIDAASQALARCGTTSWLPTTFTQEAGDLEASCAAIAEADAARGQGFLGARIQGIYLEGPFFSEAHVGAQNPAFLTDPSFELFARWQSAAGGRIVKSALAPERAGSLAYIARAAAEGVVCCIGHTDASFDQACAAVDAGATCFVHTYNGMRGLHHREPGTVGCAMATSGTYAELICDGRHVAPGAMAALVRAKGWDHVALVTDCLGCGGLPEGAYVSGGLPVVLRDGLCRLLNEDGTLGNIAGSVLTLAQGAKNMADWHIVTSEQALRMATEVPARSAGIADRCGLILPGRDADFVVLEPDLALRAAYVGGQKAR